MNESQHGAPSQTRQIDLICDAFEQGWQQESRPRLEDFLNQVGPLQQASLLRELLAVELHYRRQQGEQPTIEEYQQRLPDQADLIQECFQSRQREANVGLSTTACPHCESIVKFDVHLIGTKGRCPRCRQTFVISETNVVSQDETVDVSLDTQIGTPAHATPPQPISPAVDQQATTIQRYEQNSEAATLPPQPASSEAATLPPSGPTDAEQDSAQTLEAVAAKPVSQTSLGSFGDYELLEEIARGGMGVVYKARQKKANRIVALKMILSGQLAGPDEVARFYTEAEAAANLDHPNIVPVYDVGEQNGQHYFSMGYVEGQSLKDRVREGPLPPKEAAELVKTIAEAVAYAHDKGIIHRDLKPANILLQIADRGLPIEDDASQSEITNRKSEIPKITDFGLAKQVESDSDMTKTGQVMGTPSYMPPEQAAGKIDEIGPTADVYSLGAILYELLVGRPPFQAASTLDILMQVLEQEPVSPRQLNPAVDRDLETICLKCLEKQPHHRYTTASELVAELGRYLRGEPIQARPISRPARAWRWCKRNPVVAGLSAAVLFVLVGGVIVSSALAFVAYQNASLADSRAETVTRKSNDLNAQRIKADHEAQVAKENEQRANRQKEKADWRLYANLIAAAQREWETNDAIAAWEHLSDCRRDLRGWEHDYLFTRFTERQIDLLGHTTGVLSVAFSPDGSRIVSGSSNETVYLRSDKLINVRSDKMIKVWDAISGAEILTLQGHTADVASVAFNPDGSRIVSGSSDKTIKVWDAASGEEILTLKGHTARVTAVVFNPKGSRIVSGSYDKSIKVWDAISGAEILTLKGHTGRVLSIAFSSDGSRFVSGGAGDQLGEIKLWDSNNGRELLTLKGHTWGVVSVAFSPDGSRIASGAVDGTITQWDPVSGQKTVTVKGHKSNASSVDFSPDGSRIVSGGFDSTIKVWNDINRKKTSTLTHTAPFFSVAFNPEGSQIAGGSMDRTITLWDANSGQTILTLKGHTDVVSSVAFNRDGSRIVSGSWDKTIRVWDATSGETTLTLKGHTRWVRSVAFSPDGRYIASGSDDQTVKLFDAASGQEKLTLKGHRGPVRSVAFSPDGRYIASGSDDQTIKLFDAVSGQETLTLNGHMHNVFGVAFSSDGSRIVSGSSNMLKVWDARSGEETVTIKGHMGSAMAFSPDGSRIVSDSEGARIKVWDATSGAETLTLKGHRGRVLSIAFSSDGSRVVSGGEDSTIKVWDASSAASKSEQGNVKKSKGSKNLKENLKGPGAYIE